MGAVRAAEPKSNTRYALLYEVDEGRIVRWTIYPDVAEALEAAGLRE